MHPARKKHIRYNRASAGLWRDFEGHRARVMDLLCREPTSGGALCVLGAGNCNDLDLSQLTALFADIHLVDLDGDAMDAAVVRQGLSPGRFTLHGDVDLSGFMGLLDEQPTVDTWRKAINDLNLPELAGRFDVAISVCVLSQMGHTLAPFFEHDQAAGLELRDCLRRRHINLLGELLKPGGRAVLVADFMGSAGFPKLSLCDDADFAEVVEEGLTRERFYKQTTPALLHESIAGQPGVGNLEAEAPWRWVMWPTHFAVCGFSWRLVPE
ncbi:MAG: hypothetical protein E2O56_01885 [Gammaproteobacteria bacterium]|nr:MAG: hypothetical protein E2O56_01885 [Gammaproteobacteria bacterium]